MKKIIAAILASLLLLTAASCGESESDLFLITGGPISPYAVYQMALNIQAAPEKNVDKSITIEGDLKRSEESKTGWQLVVCDDTGCCFVYFDIEFPEKYEEFEDTLVWAKGTYCKGDGNYYIEAEEIGDWYATYSDSEE